MKSILVALDGSRDAFNASEAAWKLARANKAKVMALSVVDTQSIWDFLGHKLSGLIGSGPYISAFESIHLSMRNIADSLLMAFEARSQGFGIETEIGISEGNLAEVVLKHGENHDLIIMGRRAKFNSGNHTIYRTSLSEKVAAASKVPVMMVSSEPRRWTTARFIFNSETLDRQQLFQFFHLAEELKLKTELFCTDDSADENAQLIREYCSKEVPVLSHDATYGDESWENAIDVTSSTLIMVSTYERHGGRFVGNGPAICKFMHSLPMLTFLVFPPLAGVAEKKIMQSQVTTAVAMI